MTNPALVKKRAASSGSHVKKQSLESGWRGSLGA
jgi:hypothetical protein